MLARISATLESPLTGNMAKIGKFAYRKRAWAPHIVAPAEMKKEAQNLDAMTKFSNQEYSLSDRHFRFGLRTSFNLTRRIVAATPKYAAICIRRTKHIAESIVSHLFSRDGADNTKEGRNRGPSANSAVLTISCPQSQQRTSQKPRKNLTSPKRRRTYEIQKSTPSFPLKSPW